MAPQNEIVHEIKNLVYAVKDTIGFFGKKANLKHTEILNLVAVFANNQNFNPTYHSPAKRNQLSPGVILREQGAVKDLNVFFKESKINQELKKSIVKLMPIVADGIYSNELPILDDEIIGSAFAEAMDKSWVWVVPEHHNGLAIPLPRNGIIIEGWCDDIVGCQQFICRNDTVSHDKRSPYFLIPVYLLAAFMMPMSKPVVGYLFKGDEFPSAEDRLNLLNDNTLKSIRSFFAKHKETLVDYYAKKDPIGRVVSISMRNSLESAFSNSENFNDNVIGWTTFFSESYAESSESPVRFRREDTIYCLIYRRENKSKQQRKFFLKTLDENLPFNTNP